MGANMDSVTLRQSHFQLGTDPNPYQTSLMAQNAGIENAGPCSSSLDQNAKNELRKSHFIFGNFDPNYNTTFRREYYDKSKLVPKDNIDFKNVERRLRSQNYEFGTDKPDYISETSDKYRKPNITDCNPKQNKVSTALLQQSHYKFGTQSAPWQTTQRREFTPKKADNKLYTKNLTKTNFILGDDEPTLKSINEEVYVEHPIRSNPIDKKLLNDLRTHHFQLGKDDVPDQHYTQNQVTYQNPALYGDNTKFKPVLDNQLLRQSHWSLGDKTQELPDMYKSSYDRAHTPKKAIPNIINDATTQKSNFSINGNGPMNYQTDYRANYIPLNNKIDPKEKNAIGNLIKIIKNSHFDLGDMPNDYRTTMDNSYKFNPNSAKDAKGQLDKKLLNDLRSTHYKLGYDDINPQTTQRRDYIPYNPADCKVKKPLLQKSHFGLGNQNSNKFEGESIYMTDYVQKELPPNEKEFWC